MVKAGMTETIRRVTDMSPPATSETATEPAAVDFDALVQGTRKAPRPSQRSSGEVLKVLLGISIGLTVIVLLVIGAEFWLRYWIGGQVRHVVAEPLVVPEDSVSVELGPDLAVVQYLNRDFRTVTANVAGVSLGEAKGSALVTIQDLPTDLTLSVRSYSVAITLPSDQLAALASQSTGMTPTSLTTTTGGVQIQTNLDLGLVGSYDSAVVLRPTVGPGSIAFDPTQVTINGSTIDVEQVRDTPIIGEFLAPLLAAKEVCIGDDLASQLQLSGAATSDAGLVITERADEIVLDDTLATRGVCS